MKKSIDEIDEASRRQMNQSISRQSKQWDKVLSKTSQSVQDAFSGLEGRPLRAQAAAFGKLRVDQQQELISGAKEMVEQIELEIAANNTLITEYGQKKDKASRKQVTDAQAKNNELYEELEIHQNILQRLKFYDSLQGRILAKMKMTKQQAQEFRIATIDLVNTLRQGFNKALRNSLFLLTAIGYKLSQNTQDLITYERELLNANSVFNLTNSTLFDVGNTILEFANNFGISVDNAAAGLYQLASAGVSANDAMKILPETLKLSMAVQGDHNTISKLTAQTLFGFGMEMDQAAEVTDKFAYAIQKSLIEYQDLSSAVKFALPFFTSTGQSLDQLLGALQILTNRALEAGIAGRGLRQALAEFAESALDAEVGFRRMGVEILNAEGEMMQLTEIAAQFAAAVGPETSSNTELLTTLIEDLNVRGATAFIHLVQASDEFTEAVKSTEEAGGQLDEMVRIQNESLMAQVQILKTNIFSIFAFRDAAYEGTEFLNGFHEAVMNFVDGFKGLFIEILPDGTQNLTEFGKSIQEWGTMVIERAAEMIENDLIPAVKGLMDSGLFTKETFELLLVPLKILAGIVEWLSNRSQATQYGIFGLWIAGALGLYKALGLVWKVVKGIGQMFGVDKWLSGLFKGGKQGPRIIDMVDDGSGVFKAAGKAGILKTGAKGLGRLIPGVGWALLAADAYEYASKGTVMGFDIPGGNYFANGGYVQGMAAGGGVGGKPYIVGEQGPELFIPNQAGQVLNNSQTEDYLGGTVFRNVTIGVDSFGGLA
jgi:TP901 family phage tail tape measure protein